jgi:penicillin-binding protein 2
MTDATRVRASILGVICIALFATLFARLWFLQMVSDSTFQQAAAANSTRVIQIEAPRGGLVDSRGRVLVSNNTTPAIEIERGVPDSEVEVALGRLAELLAAAGATDSNGHPLDKATLRRRYDDPRASRFQPAIIATGVPRTVFTAIAERREEFPHVSTIELPVRKYEYRSLAAQTLGYVGEIDPGEMKDRAGQGYALGDHIGRTGAERAFERYLRGKPRRETVEVNPANQRVGDAPISVEPGRPGDNVVLTLDVNVQKTAESALETAIHQARTFQNPDIRDRYERFKAPAGSVVVLDADDGSIVASASYPSFDPTLFTLTGGIPEPYWKLFNDPNGTQPLLNRVTQGQYAPGSTFKLITALAMMDQGIRGEYTPWNDTGSLKVEDQTFRNAGGRQYGLVDLREALAKSVDTYFYEVGRQLWRCQRSPDSCQVPGRDGDAIQHVARRFGFGASTGILLSEAEGRVPDALWKRGFARKLWTDAATCKARGYSSCADAVRQNAIWYPGDNIGLAVGQGDLTVTPLQLANAYAAFANGGTLWEPRIASAVRDASGKTVHRFAPKKIRSIPLDLREWAAVHDGFKGAVQEPGGTAYEAFRGFPFDRVRVVGKTGTAQRGGKGDTSLFAAIVGDHPRYVVVAVVEEAGNGARVAAPIVRQVIEKMYGLPLTPLRVPPQQGSGQD